MIGIETYIRNQPDIPTAERLLIRHYAERQRARQGWDHRYAQMQFLLRFGRVFQRHANRLIAMSTPTAA